MQLISDRKAIGFQRLSGLGRGQREAQLSMADLVTTRRKGLVEQARWGAHAEQLDRKAREGCD